MGTERKENGCVKAPKKDVLSASELSGSWRTFETYLKKMPAIFMDERHRAIDSSCDVARQLHTHFTVMIVVENPMQRPAVVVSLLTVGMRELRGGKFGGL